MELAVDSFSIFVDQFEGVAPVSVHMAISVGDSPIAEEEGHLVGGLGSEGDEIPKHVRILGPRGRGIKGDTTNHIQDNTQLFSLNHHISCVQIQVLEYSAC